LRIEIAPPLLEKPRAMEKLERRAVGDLLEKIRVALGRPDLHHGIGLRALGSGVYECRLDVHQRIAFTAQKGWLTFRILGNHDDIQRFLRSYR
jgi:hypothetical protein